MDNVNRGVTKLANTLEFQVKMPSMNGKSFKVRKLKYLMVNLFENEDFVMGLVDLLSLFILQVVKKNENITFLLNKYIDIGF